MLYRQDFKKMLHELQVEYEICNKTMRKLPAGELHVVKRKDSFSFVQRIKKDSGCSRVFIGKDKDLILKLIQKSMLKTKKGILENNMLLISELYGKFEDYGPAVLLSKQPERIQMLPDLINRNVLEPGRFCPNPTSDLSCPIHELTLSIPADTVQSWSNEPYRQNTKNLQNKKYISSFGLAARSKSELLLIDLYRNIERPFHYDELFRAGSIWISPDIVFARDDGTLIFHEHWGLTGDLSYFRSNYEKLQKYANCGIIPGKNLLITHDEVDGSVDIGRIERMIRSFL